MTVRKVLCVDDSAAELVLIKKIVLSADPDFISATNGKDAILSFSSPAKARKPIRRGQKCKVPKGKNNGRSKALCVDDITAGWSTSRQLSS
jgi:hypothetical protein